MATTAGDLDARWVIHTVGPVFSATEDRSDLLASCYRESLRVADELGARTVAFPAISTGVYRYPMEDAARIAVDTVRTARTDVEEVRFVLFDAPHVRGVRRTAPLRHPRTQTGSGSKCRIRSRPGWTTP